MRATRQQIGGGLLVFGLVLAATAILQPVGPSTEGRPPVGEAGAGVPTPPAADRGPNARDFSSACGTLRPFFATTILAGKEEVAAAADFPAVIAYRDTGGASNADRVVLATQAQVGAVFGLAYDAEARVLYAAAYHRYSSPFGPGGPGGIYRLDVDTGAVSLWARLPAGIDRHAALGFPNRWVGTTSLGDMVIDADGESLFVANLYSGRVVRLSTADGTVLGSFPNGGRSESWRGSARLFAMAFHDGWLYHAVVQSGERLDGGVAPLVYLYRSRPDGADLESVAAVEVCCFWSPWRDSALGGSPQPIAAALDFDSSGRLVLGVRNRVQDLDVGGASRRAPLGGQLMWLRRDAGEWSLDGVTERAGRLGRFNGGAAAQPGLDLVAAVGTALDVDETSVWLNPGGRWAGEELLYRRRAESPAGMGAVVALCPQVPTRDPALVATATAVARVTRAASATAAATHVAGTATAVATAVAATRTAAAATRTALPRDPAATATQAVRNFAFFNNSCRDRPYYVVSCFARDVGLSVLAREPAIIAFNGRGEIPLASQLDVGATYGLAYDLGRGHVYAAAYHKRSAPFGPGGPGAIYRIDLATGAVEQWRTVDAGPDLHDGSALDQLAATWVGRVSLGDIELDDTASTLFVMNLFDGRVHRFSVPDGRWLGSFDASGPWAPHPFGLGYRAGWVYVGLTNDAPEGVVVRARADGSQMEEVLRFGLSYRHQPPWGPWRPVEDIFRYPNLGEAMLSDIEFTRRGDLLLGLRDRRGDSLVTAGSGDLLPARRRGDEWDVLTWPEFYREANRHPEPLWGGLAAAPGEDVALSTVVDPFVLGSGGVDWFDNATGALRSRQTIYRGAGNAASFSKAQGLGDIEGLCPNPDVPTPAPSPTASPTPSATASPTPRATATRTATPVPGPIYLPLLLSERCEDRTRHADVVLVIDTSTSMQRLTAGGRTKLTAVQEAARLFLEQMDLPAGSGAAGDQVSVATFNERARILQRLTRERLALEAALDALPSVTAQGTRLDLALDTGAEAFDDAARVEGNTAVMVLLTDGLPNQVPVQPGGTQEDTVLAAAARVHAAGIDVYAVGVGRPDAPDPVDRINARLLERVASSPDMFYSTPDAEDLADIYSRIAVTIACPPGRHKWGKPWP